MVSSILPKNERNSLFWVRNMLRLVSFIRFFGRIEETIICFRDCLTFTILWQPNRVNLTSLHPSNVPAACKDLSSNLTCATGTKPFLLSQILDYLPTLSRINALDHKCTKDQTTGNNSAGQNKIRARFLNTYTVLSVQQLSIKYISTKYSQTW